MEAIKIQVELTASTPLLGILSRMLDINNSSAPKAPKTSAKKAKITEPVADTHVESIPEAPVQEQPKATVPEAPAPKATEEAPKYDDPYMRARTKEACAASSPAAVRKLFEEFGIQNSTACPKERRAELVERLKTLK